MKVTRIELGLSVEGMSTISNMPEVSEPVSASKLRRMNRYQVRVDLSRTARTDSTCAN
jgi:hypothetical protein